ncbi:MAG: ankyrin repeat domain-containing protein, partial [Acidobacteriota bacterium]
VADRSTREDWRPLLHLVEHAGRSDRLAVIYTLEESRKAAHGRLLSGAFTGAAELELDDLSDDFLEEVIVRPFKRAGLRLSAEVVGTLKASLNALRPDDEPTAHDTILPLLALKLSHLFETVATLYEPQVVDDGLEFGDAAGGSAPFGIPPDALNLGFEALIEHQAQVAWRRSGAQLPIEIDELDHFLQPFVGVNDGKLQLPTVNRNRPYSAERRLVDQFLQARLMVPVGQEGVRLVHEAVLRHWPAAERWLGKRRDYLEMKARVAVDAEAWKLRGRPSAEGLASAGDIDDAAQILSSYLRAWSLGETQLSESEAAFRDYCLTLFDQSDTPGALVASPTESRTTHVGLAASYGRLETLERFRRVDPGCLDRVNTRNRKKTWPLHRAAWAQEEAVDFLLAFGVSATARDLDGEGWPAIAAPIQRGELGIFHSLLDAARLESAGESLEAKLAGPDGYTLLHVCAQFDRVDMARTLVAVHGFDPLAAERNHRWQPIHFAAHYDARDAWRYFKDLTPGPGFADDERTDLHIAAFNGAKSVLDEILRGYGTERLDAVDSFGQTPLHSAAAGHRPACVRALLPWVDPNAQTKRTKYTALHSAMLLPAGAKGEDAPSYEDDVLATVEALLFDSTIDVNRTDGRGRTPLAAATRFPKVQKRLLDHPAIDLTAAIGDRQAPAYVIAARLGHWRAFHRYLEEHGPPTQPDLDGRGNGFLHLLAHKRSPHALVIQHTRDLEASVLNARNKSKQTPLDVAVEHRNWPVVEHLLGLDALDLTATTGRYEVLIQQIVDADPPPDLLERILERSPELVTLRNRMGWTVWHHACAHQLVDRIEKLRRSGLEVSAVEDDQGRHPEYYLKTSPARSTWPAPRTWDHGVEWRSPDDGRSELLDGADLE